MVRVHWPCRGFGSHEFGSCGSRSRSRGSSSQSYRLMDAPDMELLDDHVPIAPLGNDVDPNAQLHVDAN